jgi:hypothetical protein
MKEIKGVGFIIPSNEDDYIDIESQSSLSDVDIAIFSPNIRYSYSNVSSTSPYQGDTLFSESYSPRMKEYIAHWKNEFNSYLARGGNLFVVLVEQENYFVYTGTRDTSGTGRNVRVTNHVAPISNYDFLPLGITYRKSKGAKIVPKSNLIKDLYNNFKDVLAYEMYIESDKLQNICFTTKTGDKILGGIVKVGKGNVILLPKIDFEIPELYEDEDEEIWTEKALQKGFSFKNCIVAIDNVIRNEIEKSVKPDWVNKSEFSLKSSEIITQKKLKLEEEIRKRKIKIEELELQCEEQDRLKDLLYESGKPLENAVIRALGILGYSAENYDDGQLELDQVIISPEGDRFIGECEGKDNKDIDITKFRQLQDGLNADFEREEVSEMAYGLLIGNPQRMIEPELRTLDFTAKCQSAAKREQMGLIKTADLFKVCRIISENENTQDFAKSCRDAIKEGLGGIIVLPDYTIDKL